MTPSNIDVWRIALAQIDPTVGDLDGNVDRIRKATLCARQAGASLVAFPELAVTGYPPEDLLLKVSFIEAARDALLDLLDVAPEIVLVVGIPWVDNGVLYNGAAVLAGGEVVAVVPKHHLPTYGVFDEDRYFARGDLTYRFLWGPLRFGVTICEDIWYPVGPASSLAATGIDLIININGSPYHRGKWIQRQTMLQTRASDAGCYLAYVNMVGGQDELVFDGNSLVLGPDGEVLAHAASFDEDLLVVDIAVDAVLSSWLHDPRRRWLATSDDTATMVVHDREVRLPLPDQTLPPIPEELRQLRVPLDGPAEIYAALVTGVRDYVRKTGFRTAVIGLSGGIDSSLTACIAADALGPENVTGLAMPSRYSSAASLEDAQQLASALGIRFHVVPIEPVHQAFRQVLAPLGNQPELPDVADENLQARIRGTILMTYSNRFGPIVLTTGNKSEMACGYATLYGDMAGGFAVLKDVPKLLVYELARYRNSLSPVIPERVFTKPPSAELRPNQKDVDTLPPFEILDPLLERYVERDASVDDLVREGFDPATVERVIRMVDRAEYKRRQAPPGVKLTPRAFGRDRRLPIANRYHG
uniref:Glutamine-dependent NAD(+) synthetase n=1 Tax=Thermorudis peleae TaxID=1382356 RepID=A0A831TA58_9BACT